MVDVKASRRKYHSPLRADQAQRTRGRVLDAAFGLFLERGYAATTVAAVADAAGVSPETIYLSLGGKRGLLEGVIEAAITGPDEGGAEDEAWWAAVAERSGPRERLAKMVEYSCAILARTQPIHAVIRGAADKEPFAAALGHRLLQDRLASQTERIRRFLGDALAPGLSIPEAGERFCVLASPDLYHLLTVELSWPADQHRDWLTQLLENDLLGLAASRSRRSRPAGRGNPAR
ncbi:MAG TPA: TetR/AcrR family transcriptional regulator [Acidimicrobiales bacterium]|nr:TetR/AcrR family transcriptional regulator [Acidimicrobiales bacterium]